VVWKSSKLVGIFLEFGIRQKIVHGERTSHLCSTAPQRNSRSKLGIRVPLRTIVVDE
jgi:hypothetical protein